MLRSERNLYKKIFLTMLMGTSFVLSGAVGHAEEAGDVAVKEEKPAAEMKTATLDEFTLDEVIVTAQRIETKDLDTPATTTIITAQKLKDSGAATVFEAIERIPGINSYSYGNGGGDYGGMYSRINIRGMDKGTLVLVNGSPVNLMNYNSMMSSIPVEAVDRVEIVKGSNAVLYGAEAMGGVINIITKKTGTVGGSATVQTGNYNKNYSVGVNSDDFSVFYKREFYNSIDDYNRLFSTTTKKTSKDKGTRDSIFMNYNINDKLSATYSYSDTDSHFKTYSYENSTKDWTKLTKDYLYFDNRQNFNLSYNDDENQIKSTFGYNKNKLRTAKDATTSTDLSSIDFNTQKAWELNDGKDTLVGGINVHRESYTQNYGAHKGDFDRDSYALYLSYTNQINDRFSTTIGAREHFVKGNEYDDAQNIFLPQLQTLYKINDNTSWYVNVGKSFELPASNSPFYGSAAISTALPLKPQEGWNYETGLKVINDTESFKLAVFKMDVKNKFKWVKENTVIPGGDPNTSIQINRDKFRNTGVEMEYTKKLNDNLQLNLGAYYGNPEAKDGDGDWTQDEARLQFSAGATYKKDKLTFDMEWFVTAKREMAYYNYEGNTKYQDHRVPDKIDLNLTMQYDINPEDIITLGGYNLLNRDNQINSTEYLSTPRNYRLSYTHKF